MDIVHILGVNHFLQCVALQCLTPAGRVDEAEQKAGLRAAIEEIVASNQVGLIAEEGKPNRRDLGGVISDEHRVEYLELTMPLSERERRGIRTPGYDRNPATRAHAYREFESYMFERVADADSPTALVICGRRHMRGLEALLNEAGVRTVVYDIYDYPWYRGVPQEDGVNVIGYDREDEG